MTPKYTGRIGPADAMSALDYGFSRAYIEATAKMIAAVMEFEKATGRIVDGIALDEIDVTTFSDVTPKQIRQCSMHFLPKPGEVAW